MPTIEERARKMMNEVRKERSSDLLLGNTFTRLNNSFIEAFCREIETLDAERAAHAQFRQKVSDAVELLHNAAPGEERLGAQMRLNSFIIAKPVDPLLHLAREMVLLDGVVRTDSQKAAIREGRAANTAADDFYDRLRTALPARGLKLVENADA